MFFEPLTAITLDVARREFNGVGLPPVAVVDFGWRYVITLLDPGDLGETAQAGSAGFGHLVPQPTIQVDVVAVVLSGSGIADVGVKRMRVIRGLRHAVRAFDGA